jgi:hypothetical protein
MDPMAPFCVAYTNNGPVAAPSPGRYFLELLYRPAGLVEFG